MKFSYVLAAMLAVSLTACVSKLVDDDFTGPTATVRDSYTNFVKGNLIKADRADFFVMTGANGKSIDNALQKTAMINQGSGFSLKPYGHERRVPIQPLRVQLHAVTYYSAPISAMFNNTHEVRGTVSFQPAAGQTYVVTGEMRDGYSAVWIATTDGRIVTEKVVQNK